MDGGVRRGNVRDFQCLCESFPVYPIDLTFQENRAAMFLLGWDVSVSCDISLHLHRSLGKEIGMCFFASPSADYGKSS